MKSRRIVSSPREILFLILIVAVGSVVAAEGKSGKSKKINFTPFCIFYGRFVEEEA